MLSLGSTFQSLIKRDFHSSSSLDTLYQDRETLEALKTS